MLLAKTHQGSRDSQPTTRYFVDKFPMFLSDESLASPVVTFTFLQGSEVSLTEFVHHLQTDLPLFRQLSEFRLLYLEMAKERFDSLVTIPLQSDAAADIVRYFSIRKACDLKLYGTLSEADLIFRNNAKARFPGNRFENLYRGWKAGRLADASIRREFGGDGRPHTVHFAAQIVPRIAPASTQGG